MAFKKETFFERFDIGTVDTVFGDLKKFWTNMALDHLNGRLTNETLLRMTNAELELLVITGKNSVLSEMYKRPDDKEIASKQGGEPGEIYKAPHRGLIILEYRAELQKVEDERIRREQAFSKRD